MLLGHSGCGQLIQRWERTYLMHYGSRYIYFQIFTTPLLVSHVENGFHYFGVLERRLESDVHMTMFWYPDNTIWSQGVYFPFYIFCVQIVSIKVDGELKPFMFIGGLPSLSSSTSRANFKYCMITSNSDCLVMGNGQWNPIGNLVLAKINFLNTEHIF